MSVIDKIEEGYRKNPLHGVQFSIDASAYECDRDVTFSENTTEMQHGDTYNWQDVILDGKYIGFLEEVYSGKLLHPMTVSFYVPLPEDGLTEEVRNDPHYFEDEWYFMRFANLQDMVNYVESKR